MIVNVKQIKGEVEEERNFTVQHLNRLFPLTANLKKMLKKVAESKNEDEQLKNFDAIQEIINNIQFAYDEGDNGEVLFSELT